MRPSCSLKYLISFSLCALAVGCGKKVQNDLLNYINKDLKSVEALESKAMDKYNSMIGKDDVSDAQLSEALTNTVVPTYRQYIEKVEAFKPETEEVRKMHELLIDAANAQMSGFTLMMDAIGKGSDLSIVTKANEKFGAGKKGLREWEAKLNDLCKANGVEFKK